MDAWLGNYLTDICPESVFFQSLALLPPFFLVAAVLGLVSFFAPVDFFASCARDSHVSLQNIFVKHFGCLLEHLFFGSGFLHSAHAGPAAAGLFSWFSKHSSAEDISFFGHCSLAFLSSVTLETFSSCSIFTSCKLFPIFSIPSHGIFATKSWCCRRGILVTTTKLVTQTQLDFLCRIKLQDLQN